jgi:polar amino acid transport system ATP-binding protein
VTHEIGFARDASKRIVFMADGVIGAEGPPSQIFAPDQPNERLRSFLGRFSAAHRL